MLQVQARTTRWSNKLPRILQDELKVKNNIFYVFSSTEKSFLASYLFQFFRWCNLEPADIQQSSQLLN